MQIASQLIDLESALSQMLDAVTPITDSCTLPLIQCNGRISACAIASPRDVPDFASSAMDGYAVRIAEVSSHMPLPIAGTAFAGHPFIGRWPAASCVRVTTGAMLPPGCEAVIMQEDATVNDEGVCFCAIARPGQNMRQCGEDICQGEVVIQAGEQLNAASLPLLASLGISEVAVVRKLRVAIFSTGDELCLPHQSLLPGQIYDSNRLTMRLLLEQLHCDVIDLGIIPDDPTALRQAFIDADQQADVVISSAGVSVGDLDYTKTVLQEQGQVVFWRLAIKPGKPFAFGRLHDSWFCGLPGNPVSALVTFCQLVQPLLAKLSGKQGRLRPIRLRVRLQQPLHKIPGRLEFQRGILQRGKDGQPEVISTGAQGSHIFSSLHQANCLIVLERERGAVAAGEWVDVEPLHIVARY